MPTGVSWKNFVVPNNQENHFKIKQILNKMRLCFKICHETTVRQGSAAGLNGAARQTHAKRWDWFADACFNQTHRLLTDGKSFPLCLRIFKQKHRFYKNSVLLDVSFEVGNREKEETPARCYTFLKISSTAFQICI